MDAFLCISAAILWSRNRNLMAHEDIDQLTALVTKLPGNITLTKDSLRQLAREQKLNLSEEQLDTVLASRQRELSEEALDTVVGGAGIVVPPWYKNSEILRQALNREF